MDSLFGISMDLIMWVLVALLSVSLLSVAYVALKNRVMFRLGVRNIPRRRAQTTLIIVGLMLSTVIISAALTTGDTVGRSITAEVYSIFGSLDQVIQLRHLDEDNFEDPNEAGLTEPSFDAAAVEPLVAALRDEELVDYVIPAYSRLAVAVNPEKRLSSPLFNVLGLDPEAARGLPDIESTTGRRLEVGQLAAGEIYVNRSAAEELDLRAGDSILLIVFGRPVPFIVKDVVQDGRLTGSAGISIRREGGVMSLAAAQQLFGEPGRLTMIAVSNQGDARAGLRHTDAVTDLIESRLATLGPTEAGPLSVLAVKRTGVDVAEFGANILTTFFLVFGLFSIGAGVLLIFLIFVMLAAERKPEMGMARAVGLKRGDLVQTFLAEGMAYNVVSAAVGAGLGVLVAFLVSRAMAGIFAQADIQISPYVTPRSLVIAYSLGVVLTFLTVTFSSWRVSYLNIVRAIRDIPEPPAPKPEWRARGFWPTLGRLVFKPGFLQKWRPRLGTERWSVTLPLRAWQLRIALFAAGLVLQSAAAGSGSSLGQILLGTLGGLAFLAGIFLIFQTGFVFIVGSIPLLLLGAAENLAFPLLFGLSLLPLGIALTARSFGANERLTYTAAGLVILYIWEFDFSVGLIEAIFGEAEGDIEMFFLAGVMITIAATFVIVYNADLILSVLTRLGQGLGALLPSIKMAVAYPLANRSRTGMTMAMFCLVVFALVVMSSMNHNFNRLFLSDRSLGGWDISVQENPTNPIADLRASLQEAGSPVVSDITAVGSVSVAARSRTNVCHQTDTSPCRVANRQRDFVEYPVWGVDRAFVEAGSIPLQARARGYESDEAVWQAMARDPSLAVVDNNALGGGFGLAGFVRGVSPGATSFDPLEVVVVDGVSGRSGTITIIGIIEIGASNTFLALQMSQQRFQEVFGAPDARRLYVQTRPGTDDVEAARQIESALLTSGAQADSLKKIASDQSATFRSFFYLLQGFMGLGLFVGVAAVGVIAFRTVVERRQQIGMLRAIGYSRGMIGLTFLIESAFIAFLGVLSGVVFALILARQLITTEFANQGISSFAVPWLQVLVIALAAFGFALLMTLIPSRQAANIPIAQALRYE